MNKMRSGRHAVPKACPWLDTILCLWWDTEETIGADQQGSMRQLHCHRLRCLTIPYSEAFDETTTGALSQSTTTLNCSSIVTAFAA